MKQALGLAVSGTEVRLAQLSLHNGQIHIEGLERARLRTTLENKPAEAEEAKKNEEAETGDAFGLKESGREKNSGRDAAPAPTDNGNLEIIYRLLEKYTKKKTKIAFNLPLSMVTYKRHEMGGAPERAEEAIKGVESNFAEEVITAHDGSRLIMSYEKHPPTIALMREVNEFLRGNLALALMDSTEVALANLARRGEELEAGKVTAIVYIEDDFTRLIFLRGKDLLHVSSIMHENTASPDILEVIYRKLIYEQDEAQIPELATILLAGKSSRIKAREFFTEYFQSARVDYLTSPQVTGLSSNDVQRGVFSEFAVPIALAWKTLEPKSPFFIPTNLLPQELLDQQQILKLNYHGYILLALTGVVAFFMTWQIIRISKDIREMRRKNTQLEQKIADNQETVDRVMLLDNQCQRLQKNLFLVDSLGRGHEEFLAFLQKLNGSVGRVGNIWVDEIITSTKGFSVRGTSLSREAIPMLAERLERASLSEVTRLDSEKPEKRKAFSFSLERQSEPDTAKIGAQGLSSIDAARYAGNGNLIFSKDGVRPAAAPNTTVAPAPPPPTRDEPASNQTTTLPKPETAKSETAPRNGALTQPVTRPTSSLNDGATLNKNQSKISTIAAQEKSSLVTQPTPPNGAARKELSETKISTVAAPEKSSSVIRPSLPSTNGAARTELSETKISTVATPEKSATETFRPALSRPAEAPPETARPEIYRAYTIEAATSYTIELAEQYATAYRKQGHNAAVESYLDNRTGAQKYRVLIGAFATRPAAEKKAAQIAGLLMKEYRVVGIK